MPEPADIVRDWEKVLQSLISSAGAAVPRQLVEPMERQLELVRELLERERTLRSELTRAVLAPFDAVFDLLAESGSLLRRQAEAIEQSGRALEEGAAVLKLQAELFERTVSALRQPGEVAKAAATMQPLLPPKE